MTPSPEDNTLGVFLNQTFVGRIHLDPSGIDQTEFKLDQSYMTMADRPVLGQTFEDSTEPRRARVRVPAFFSNLLPEGALRELLARRAGVSAAREFFLLRELGADLPGAVRVSALGSIVDSPTGLAAELPAPVATDEPLRFSLAGLQLKFSAEASGNGWRLPVRGMGGRWLLKVPDAKYKSVPLNEWAMMTLARRIGLDVAQVRLIDLSEVVGLPQEFEMPESKALLVERFDRQEQGPRIHTEDFLQVLDKHPDGHDIKYRAASYNSIAKVVYSLGGMADFEEFVRRLVFNIWAGNSDAHLKNWSLIYRDPKRPRLAPAYDLVSTIWYLPDQMVALNLGGEKRYSSLDITHFAKLADVLVRDPVFEAPPDLAMRVEEWVGDTLAKLDKMWPAVRAEVALPIDFDNALENHWARTLLKKDPPF